MENKHNNYMKLVEHLNNQVNEGSTNRRLIEHWDLICDAIGETQVLQEVWYYFSERELSKFVDSVATDYDIDLD